jgi:hypothetical protein
MPTVGIWGDRHPVTRFLYSDTIQEDLPQTKTNVSGHDVAIQLVYVTTSIHVINLSGNNF